MVLQWRVLSSPAWWLTDPPDRIPCATFSLHPGRGAFPWPAGTVSAACFLGGLKGIFSLRLMTSDSTPSGPWDKIKSETIVNGVKKAVILQTYTHYCKLWLNWMKCFRSAKCAERRKWHSSCRNVFELQLSDRGFSTNGTPWRIAHVSPVAWNQWAGLGGPWRSPGQQQAVQRTAQCPRRSLASLPLSQGTCRSQSWPATLEPLVWVGTASRTPNEHEKHHWK